MIAVAPAGGLTRAAGPQHPTDLIHHRVDLLRGQHHAQQHVREHRIDRRVRQGQQLTDIVCDCSHPVLEPPGEYGPAQLLQAGL